ncbi:hypothetical protein J6590_061817 [Homalodisca vitripennis]|nr:hypothetical protein J6590_061817 [Homalodisca vitripennis]
MINTSATLEYFQKKLVCCPPEVDGIEMPRQRSLTATVVKQMAADKAGLEQTRSQGWLDRRLLTKSICAHFDVWCSQDSELLVNTVCAPDVTHLTHNHVV